MRRSGLLLLLLIYCFCLRAQQGVSHLQDPLAVVKLVGDKLIRDTPFRYRLVVAPNKSTFDGLQFVDFGRSFPAGQPAVAYAYTNLQAPEAMEMTLQVAHNDGCRIWVNGQLVYEKKGDRPIGLVHEERSIELPHHFKVKLRAGNNPVLVKSETRGPDWRVYLQPPSTKGAVLAGQGHYPQIGLQQVDQVDARIAGLTNWLVIGPFPNPVQGGRRRGLDVAYAPEKEIRFGRMYPGLLAPITWTIPKIEIHGDMIDPLPWGTNYHWNYHNGGVAWAMQQLSEVSGDPRYDAYAARFCDFHLQGIPFVEHQVHTLNAFESANHHIINTPLLDFTLAPSLPYVYRLRKQPDFANRADYVRFVDRMLTYSQKEQIRLPGSTIYTRVTPEKYTTWVDDMFMGIPFLVQASQYVQDPKVRKALLDDAAGQVLGFTPEVWDPQANLYMHARYHGNPVKLPHWSRANGWAIWATSEVLMSLPKNHPRYKAILAQYRRHVGSLARLQDKSGFWFNVLDRPDSPKEVSGTAIFTMAIARGVTHGWLGAKKFKPVVLKGWEALKTQIEPDGTVHRICMGTMCSTDVDYYIQRPFYDNDTHGLFAVLFAGIEVHNMLHPAGRPAKAAAAGF